MGVATVQGLSGQILHLGRLPPNPFKRNLRFGYYFDSAVAAAPPDSLDLTDKAQASLARMYLNDQYGDCVIAGKYHTIGMMTGEDIGTPRVGDDSEVLKQYHRICGGGDNGCVITDVLDDMVQGNFVVGAKKAQLDGYASVDNSNTIMAKVAMVLFGPLTLGIDLPSAWTGSNEIWDVTNTRNVGGHDVCTAGYDAQYVKISSWGKIYKMTWPAFNSGKWITECHVLFAQDWYGDDRIAPGGVNADQLKLDLQAIKEGRIPDINPDAFVDFGQLA